MVAHRKRYFENSAASIEAKMAYMAIAVSYHLGNRPSEGSSNGPLQTNENGGVDEDHMYTTEDSSTRQPTIPASSVLTSTNLNKDEIQ